MKTKIKAIIEVFFAFCLTLFLVALVGISSAGAWIRRVTGYSFLEYSVMIVVPLLLLLIMRRNRADYGLSLKNLKYHLDIAITGFLPVAAASIPFAFIDYRQWSGAFVLAGVRIGLLLTLAALLRKKPSAGQNERLIGLSLFWFFSEAGLSTVFRDVFFPFLFYIFFLALGEELLFRGYIQSRINAVFGRPFRFFGVPWGCGVLVSSALFGLLHAVNLGGWVAGREEFVWAWGFWTFFSGLMFGFLREKTGGIIVPTLLHGLPVAIANMF